MVSSGEGTHICCIGSFVDDYEGCGWHDFYGNNAKAVSVKPTQTVELFMPCAGPLAPAGNPDYVRRVRVKRE